MQQTSQVRRQVGERPMYRKIADELLNGISSGIFPVGSLLPGELDLIQRYSSSRHTVREALRMLEDMGIVKRQRGRGTLVLSPDARPAFVQMVRSPEELFSYPKDSALRIVAETTVVADSELAKLLNCSKGADWAKISGPRVFANGEPVCWTDIYLLPEFSGVSGKIGGPRPVYEIIAETYGEQVQKINIEIHASSFESERAQFLGVEPGTPSLCLCRRYQGNGGRTFEVSISEHPAKNYSYAFEFNSGWQAAEHWSWSK